MTQRNDKTSLTAGADFLIKVSEVFVIQVLESKTALSRAIESLFEYSKAFDEVVTTKKQQAATSLEKSYLSPDETTEKFITAAQNSVDELIAQYALTSTSGKSIATDDASSSNEQVRLLAGKLSKQVESVSTTDLAVSEYLLELVAVLSNDDVLSKRLDNIVFALNLLQQNFLRLKQMDDSGVRKEFLERMSHEMPRILLSQYETLAEQRLFSKFFGNREDTPPKKDKNGSYSAA